MSNFLIKALTILRRSHGFTSEELGETYELKYIQRPRFPIASNWAVFTRWPTKPEVFRWAALYTVIIALMGAGTYWFISRFQGPDASIVLRGEDVSLGSPWPFVLAVAGAMVFTALTFFPYKIKHSMTFDKDLADTFTAILQLAKTDEQKATVSDLVRRHHNLQTEIETAGRQPGYSFEGPRRDAIELEVKALEEQQLELVGQAEEKLRGLLKGTWAADPVLAE